MRRIVELLRGDDAPQGSLVLIDKRYDMDEFVPELDCVIPDPHMFDRMRGI